MNHWQANFVRRVGEVPGVTGCGLLHPDRSKVLHSNDGACPEAAIEAALRVASDTFHVLRLHRQEPQRLRWVFEKSFLHCLCKREEAVVVVFTSKNFRLLDSTALERLFLEFHQR